VLSDRLVVIRRNGPAFLAGVGRNHRALLAILALALVFRLAFFVEAMPWDDDVVNNQILRPGDPSQYHEQALSFIDNDFGLFFSGAEPAYDGRTPGYPMFLTSVYMVFGERIWLALFIQSLVGVATVAVVYLIALELFASRRAAAFSALLFSLSLFPAYWAATQLLTETWFTFFVSLATLAFVGAVKRDSLRWLALTGLLLGAGALVRPVLQYAPIIVVLVLLLRRKAVSAKLLSVVVFVAAFVVTISPWQLRNLVVYNHYSLSPIGANWLAASVVPLKARTDSISRQEAKERLEISDTFLAPLENKFDKSSYTRKKSLAYIAKEPLAYAKQHIKGVFALFVGTDKGVILYALLDLQKPYSISTHPMDASIFDRVRRVAGDMPEEYYLTPILGTKLLLEYALFAIGLMTLVRRDMRIQALFIILLIGYLAFGPGSSGYSQRFKIPVIPLYLALAGAGVEAVWMWVSNRSHRQIQLRRMSVAD